MTGPGDEGRDSPPDATFAELMNGFTFDSGRRRGRKRRQRGDEPAEHPAEHAAPAEPAGPGDQTGQFARPWPDADYTGRARPGVGEPLFDRSADGVDELSGSAAIVRPYAWTRGRTKASQHLELETLVSTSDTGWNVRAIGHMEHRTVAELCRHPHAVAEVAAKLSVPLGVARVLLSDMAEQGLITVHQTVAEDDDTAAQLMLMERVLSGLRRL